MDWFRWLSKTGLDPTLVYEYGVAFGQNELEHDDIPYFNHEFLQSMGIGIAKHRLHILKLARSTTFRSRVLNAIKHTKRGVSNYLRIRGWIQDSNSNKNRKLTTRTILSVAAPLLLTDGRQQSSSRRRVNSFVDHDYCCSWSSEAEEIIRWDTMFQNLKPT